jgi:activator of HSP90 ATPase
VAKFSKQMEYTCRPTRRQLITGAMMAIGVRAAGSNLEAKTQQSSMKDGPGSGENAARTSLHQEGNLKLPPAAIYELLLDSKQFAAFSGMPAEIDAKAGGAFSLFQGMIVGRNIELVPGQRIVQAWRPASWVPGNYSIVKFELKPSSSGTTVILDHTGFAPGLYDHLSMGWEDHYWEPVKKFLG